MKIGIVGLPNAGKTSLFNLLTGAGARVDLFPFTTIEKNVGVVTVPDERLIAIADVIKPKKVTPAHIDFVDIAGLVKGASAGEGLGNKFLAHIREADLLLHLIRNFNSPDIPHILDSVNPDRDAEIVEAELAIADLGVVEKRLATARKEPETPEKHHLITALEKLTHSLQQAFIPPELTPEERRAVRELSLFVLKPIVYALNCSDAEPADLSRFPRLATRKPILFSCELEQVLTDLSETDKVEMRTSLNLNPEGPAAIITTCFNALNLIRFYTVKGVETRAWSVPAGITALDAAFMIHTDIGKGFIKAEVVRWEDLCSCGGFQAAHNAGKVKIEGKNYCVQDGDVLLIRFK
uniref:Redox-regulated ATPase YchF n=1 Tax=candidate division WOR-3 bacterium TaxID=2052148 RepID=A0A7V3PUT5_UNCW3